MQIYISYLDNCFHFGNLTVFPQESSQKKVPIMLCGNKCDLREEYLMEGKKVISKESGQRLAKVSR